jgi:ParB-like chromosome segregation protein Spo0J
MSDAEFDSLVTDIKQNGQLDSIIITHNNEIVDGRHRYRACRQLGIEPRTTPWDGNGSIEAFVISKNLRRRQLDASQRAMAAAAYATLKRGGDKLSANLRKGPTAAEVAALFGVSTRSIETARVVRLKGAPELLEAVQRGAIKVSAAEALVDHPKDRQRELAAAGKHSVRRTVNRLQRSAAIRKERADRKPPESKIENDTDFQAEADAAARDIEIERHERIGLAGAGELEIENENYRKQTAALTRRIARLVEENSSLKFRVEMWRKRATAAGWKEGQDDA